MTWCFSRPRNEDQQGIKLYDQLTCRQAILADRQSIRESIFMYNRFFCVKYWMFCTFSSVDSKMGFENYVLNIINFDCNLQIFPVHVCKNVSIKYKPTVFKNIMYVSTMGYNITNFGDCQHTIANPYRCELLHQQAKLALKEIVFNKAKTMSLKQLVDDVNNSVVEMAVRYSILVSPKLVYEMSITAKRLIDNLECIKQNCKCLRIISTYCHCATVQYFV